MSARQLEGVLKGSEQMGVGILVSFEAYSLMKTFLHQKWIKALLYAATCFVLYIQNKTGIFSHGIWGHRFSACMWSPCMCARKSRILGPEP